MNELRFKNLTPAPRGPTVPQMAVNFAGAVARTGRRLLTGQSLRVPGSVAEARLAICRDCPQHVRNQEAERCLDPRCGCFLSSLLLSKVNWASETCPDGKWV